MKFPAPRLHPCSLSFSLALFLLLTLISSAYAAEPTITVVSPTPGATVGSPVYFEAYAYSTTCASGINAMRIYSSEGVVAATASSNHISRFIPYSPTSTTATFVAYDNCGGTSAVNVPITITGNTGISVFLPSATSASVPVHIVASAKSYTCDNDIDAMRIYVAPGVAPYSIFGNQVDAFLTLSPGTYNMVVQAWDNCGNVLKYPMTVKVEQTPDKFLYATGGAAASNNWNTDLLVFPLSKGALGTPNLVTHFNEGSSARPLNQIIVDPAGYIVYTTDGHSIFAFQIDRNNGSLQGVPGSPYQIINPASGGPDIWLALDPNNHFLYVTNPINNTLSDYQIDPSDGSLQPLYTVTTPFGLPIVNYTGSFVYVVSNSNSTSTISGFEINTNTGTIFPTPGSPYAVSGSYPNGTLQTTAWKYLYVGNGPVNGYDINADGSLTPIAGSPFSDKVLPGPLADWLARYIWSPGQTVSSSGTQEYDIVFSDISGSGAPGAPNQVLTGQVPYGALAEDHSGLYLYGVGENFAGTSSSCASTSMEGPPPLCPDVATSWSIGSGGAPLTLSGPTPTGYNSINPPQAVATSR